ncbi:MAG: nitroreductase family protein [bacterium]
MNETISIDYEKCTECGLCARDCVSGVYVLQDGKPEIKNPDYCNKCSHCVAVCPAEAITHHGLSGTPARPVDRKKIDAKSYRETVLSRRSVRLYKQEPVPKEDIEDILDVARYSPTASNTMDVGYVVITDPDLIDKTGRKIFREGEKLMERIQKRGGWILKKIVNLAMGGKGIELYLQRLPMYRQWLDQGRNPVTHNAPALIIIHGPKKGRFVRENCAIAATNITNYAHALGYGTCYLGLVVVPLNRKKSLSRKLGVPEGRRACLVLALGKPDFKYRNIPVRPPARVSWS